MPDHLHPGQFSVGACSRLKGHPIHSRDLGKKTLKFIHQSQNPLREVFRGEGMEMSKPLHPRNFLIHLWIVFHRAGAQRIKTAVDAVVPLRKPGEVANHIDLAQLWKSLKLFPQEDGEG